MSEKFAKFVRLLIFVHGVCSRLTGQIWRNKKQHLKIIMQKMHKKSEILNEQHSCCTEFAWHFPMLSNLFIFSIFRGRNATILRENVYFAYTRYQPIINNQVKEEEEREEKKRSEM